MIRNNYFLPISFNPTIPRKHTGVFFWTSKTQMCIHWFICGSLPGKFFKSTWLSMWQVGGIFRNPVEKKNPITSLKEQVCESVFTVQKEGRGQLNHPPYSILILRVQFQLHPVCGTQCDKLSLSIIPFLCQKLPDPICILTLMWSKLLFFLPQDYLIWK